MESAENILVLESVCQKLEKADIPYMVTGSFASNFYSEPRMTRDIDIVVELSRYDTPKLCGLFKEDFYLERDAVLDAIERKSMFNIIHQGTVFKVDFIVRKDEEYRKAEFLRKRRAKIFNIPVWIVSPEDLVLSKLFWAKDSLSDIQIRDIRNILESVKAIEQAYLDQWVDRLGLEEVYNKVNSHG